MQPKTEKEIEQTFKNLTAHISNETAAYYLSDTELIFHDKIYSCAKTYENIICFSMSEYYRDFSISSILEYKKVLKRIKMPFYADCNGYYRILTPEPHVYTLLHEISHVITHVIHPNAPTHGEEFCDVYIHLIELIEPKTISPIGDGGFITWRD